MDGEKKGKEEEFPFKRGPIWLHHHVEQNPYHRIRREYETYLYSHAREIPQKSRSYSYPDDGFFALSPNHSSLYHFFPKGLIVLVEE